MRRDLLVVGGGLIAMLVGCGDPTIRVVVGTDDQDVTNFTVRVLRDDDEKFFDEFFEDRELPASLILENADTSDDRDVVVIVEGNTVHPNDNISPVVIRRSARLDFHTEDVVLPMPLCEACAGLTCEDGQTCNAGSCVSDKVAEEELDPDDEQDVETDCSGGGGGAGGGGPTCAGVCGDAGCGDCPEFIDYSYHGRTCRNGYCINSFEVSRELYQLFNALDHAVESECSIEPDAADLSAACTSDCDRHPVVGIPQCAARAYCEWAGERLCTPEEWIGACRTGMQQGTFDNAFFYGDTYEAGTCNDGTVQMSTVPADPNSTCRSGDLYNMSGNVKEWTTECDTSGSCTVRGGGFQGGSASQFDCGTVGAGDLPATATDTAPDIGFRCCSAE